MCHGAISCRIEVHKRSICNILQHLATWALPKATVIKSVIYAGLKSSQTPRLSILRRSRSPTMFECPAPKRTGCKSAQLVSRFAPAIDVDARILFEKKIAPQLHNCSHWRSSSYCILMWGIKNTGNHQPVTLW